MVVGDASGPRRSALQMSSDPLVGFGDTEENRLANDVGHSTIWAARAVHVVHEWPLGKLKVHSE